MKPNLRRSSLFALPLLAACGAPATPATSPASGVAPPEATVAPAPQPPLPSEPAPTVRLPADVHPIAQKLVLTIDPSADRFSGVADIDVLLDKSRSTVWVNGKKLSVSRVTARSGSGPELVGTWAETTAGGFASITFAQVLPAGNATLHLEYDAPFEKSDGGLYKFTESGTSYAFTQFESIFAREAFPCFDEPDFKIPFDVTLVVPQGAQAISNAHEVERKTEGANVRVHFAKTEPLPSYLVAFAVGPLDIVAAPDLPPNGVRKRPLPFRIIATKGQGARAAYAAAHGGEILSLLEQYFGIEYPYDKLDLLAVGDKGGAMENAGAVTFGDVYLLFDEKDAPPFWRQRSFAGITAHELAHQWFGDLVTARFWNDIWLNEAFATWLAPKVVEKWNAKMDAPEGLLDNVQGAMLEDSLVNARSIRQPIVTNDDILNAFDGITYQKGAGVLSMFERWIGPDKFQRGVAEYMTTHRFGNGTADDFLDAESHAAGRDVKTPFHTFLDQPGVPFITASVKCDGTPRLHMKQSRFLPVGSTGDTNKTWQIPVCATYPSASPNAKAGTAESCTLLTDVEGDLPLGATCPAWVMPNADGAGYYGFTLAPDDLKKLRTLGLPKLSWRERIAYETSITLGYKSAATSFKDAIEAAAALAGDPHPDVSGEAMGFVGRAIEWFHGEPALLAAAERYGAKLYKPIYKRLGWEPKKGEAPEVTELRSSVISFLAFTAKDKEVRAEAKRRGLLYLGYKKDGALHPEAVDSTLVGIAVSVVGEEADRALWDATKKMLKDAVDPVIRGRLLAVLVQPKAPAMADAVRELTFDPVLRPTEVFSPIFGPMGDIETRDAAWAWAKANFDRLTAVLPARSHAALARLGSDYCDEAHAKDIESFFTKERVAAMEGAPRILASNLEGIRLCAARSQAQEPSGREFFSKMK
ncbi:MAG: M1 family metallopeptidase [Polyangiaceae bacterium]